MVCSAEERLRLPLRLMSESRRDARTSSTRPREHDPRAGFGQGAIRVDGAAAETPGGVALEIARRLHAEARAGVLPAMSPGNMPE